MSFFSYILGYFNLYGSVNYRQGKRTRISRVDKRDLAEGGIDGIHEEKAKMTMVATTKDGWHRASISFKLFKDCFQCQIAWFPMKIRKGLVLKVLGVDIRDGVRHCIKYTTMMIEENNKRLLYTINEEDVQEIEAVAT